MDKPNQKVDAAEAMLNLKLGEIHGNPYAERLKSAFDQGEPEKAPDFESIKRDLLRHKEHVSARQPRRGMQWKQISLTAAATTLLAAGLIGWLWSSRQTKQDTPLATVLKGEVRTVQIHGGLNLKIREGQSIEQSSDGKSYNLKADVFYSLVQFNPTAALQKIRFSMPLADFEIVGTNFLLNCTKESAFLAVSEGAVRVKYQNTDTVIRSGHFWSADKNKAVEGALGSRQELLFRGFEGDIDANQNLIKRIVESPSKSRETNREVVRITVSLKTGSLLRGILLSEKDGDIEIQTPATGTQVLRFRRDEIAELHYHLPKK